MTLHLEGDGFLVIEETESTQRLAEKLLTECQNPPGAVFAHHQTQGKGRHGRAWLSSRGDSLTMSLIFSENPDTPQPWLIGMAVACAAAGLFHCQVRWPNDLVFRERKLGGVLTELLPNAQGRQVPVVGIGINLNQKGFPEDLAPIATSLRLAHPGSALGDDAEWEPLKVARRLAERVSEFPMPTSWADLRPIWGLFDATQGKEFKLGDGRTARAIGIGPNGELLAEADGEPTLVHAADALFGPGSR